MRISMTPRPSVRFALTVLVQLLFAARVSGQEPEAMAPAVPPAPAPAPEKGAETVPRFPGTISVEARLRYYAINNLYDLNSKHDDRLDIGTERVGVRAEGQPLEGLTLRVGVFQVHSLGLDSHQVFDVPNVVDERERPVEVDRALLEWKPADLPGLTLTAGRQEIVFGAGFLIGDGVRLEDKSNLLGYLEDNRTDFDALRAEWKGARWTLNAFGARVRDTESGTSDRHLWLAALDVEREIDQHRPALTIVYARDVRPRTELYGPVIGFPFTSPLTPFTSDDANAWTTAFALRCGGPLVGPLGYRAEVVHEIGKSPNGANNNTFSADLVSLRAWGVDTALAAFLSEDRQSVVRVRHVYLSGYRPGTGNDQYDPLFDNQILGYLANLQNNVRAINLGASIASLSEWTFQAEVWHFRFDKAYDLVLPYGLSRSGYLSAGDEIDLVIGHHWCPHFMTELGGGLFFPGKAWRPDNGNPLGFNTSNDRVWAIRLTATVTF
jgi:hypothetical protein